MEKANREDSRGRHVEDRGAQRSGDAERMVAVVLLGSYFIYSAVMEERYMAGRFPDAYPKYKQSSKMLIPFIF